MSQKSQELTTTKPDINAESIAALLEEIPDGWYEDVHRSPSGEAVYRIFDKHHQGVCKMTSGGEFHDKPNLAFIAAAPDIARAYLELSKQVERESEAERIRIVAYLSYDTVYTDDFCVRCFHCPTNCECEHPVYMARWEPSGKLGALKIALFQEDRSAALRAENAELRARLEVCERSAIAALDSKERNQ